MKIDRTKQEGGAVAADSIVLGCCFTPRGEPDGVVMMRVDNGSGAGDAAACVAAASLTTGVIHWFKRDEAVYAVDAIVQVQ